MGSKGLAQDSADHLFFDNKNGKGCACNLRQTQHYGAGKTCAAREAGRKRSRNTDGLPVCRIYSDCVFDTSLPVRAKLPVRINPTRNCPPIYDQAEIGSGTATTIFQIISGRSRWRSKSRRVSAGWRSALTPPARRKANHKPGNARGPSRRS
jgi:hypothetical protein